MAKYIMALDAGTTSNRCILFNEKGEILMNPIYVFEEDEKSTLERVSGGLVRTKNEMKNVEKLRQAGILENI